MEPIAANIFITSWDIVTTMGFAVSLLASVALASL